MHIYYACFERLTNEFQIISKNSGQSTCEVRYEVIAEVFQKPNSMFHSNPSAREELAVAAASSVSPGLDTSLLLPAELFPINACCCFSCSRQGDLALETKIDNTTVLVPSGETNRARRRREFETYGGVGGEGNRDDAVTVHFRCQNQSAAKVRSVRAQLVETVEWTSNGHKESKKTTLAESGEDATQYPELEPLRRKPSRRERVDDSEMPLLLRHNPWRAVGPLVVPASANDTYQGRFVQVRHALPFQIITEDCCATNPDVTSLINIYRRGPSTEFAAAMAGFGQQEQQYAAPSAPFEDEIAETVTGTAPSDIYDSNLYESNAVPSYHAVPASYDAIPEVEAQLVLPEDWKAQTAEVVNIPTVEATILRDD